MCCPPTPRPPPRPIPRPLAPPTQAPWPSVQALLRTHEVKVASLSELLAAATAREEQLLSAKLSLEAEKAALSALPEAQSSSAADGGERPAAEELAQEAAAPETTPSKATPPRAHRKGGVKEGEGTTEEGKGAGRGWAGLLPSSLFPSLFPSMSGQPNHSKVARPATFASVEAVMNTTKQAPAALSKATGHVTEKAKGLGASLAHDVSAAAGWMLEAVKQGFDPATMA